jgi:hypothetical protein
VSRKHCRIVKVDRSWYVEQDPESKNGVYYKDEPRPIGPDRRVELMDDDCIHLVNEVSTSVRTVRVSYVFKLGKPSAAPGPAGALEDAGDVRQDTEARPEDHLRSDLECHMCFELAVNAVRIEPRAHAWCAGCLELHFETRRKHGLPLSCPLCRTPPQSVVKAGDVSERAEAEIARRPDLEPEARELQASNKLPGPLDVFGLALQYASDEFLRDREVVLAAVGQDGMALEYASGDLRNYPYAVLTAVRQNGLALEYASDELRNEREVVLTAREAVWRGPSVHER